MNDFAIYMYESGICLAVLFALYWLVLRKETYFEFNRFYLLGALVVSCLLPLGHLNFFGSESSSSGIIPRMAEVVRIPEMKIADGSSHLLSSSLHWQLIALVIYLTGTTFLIVRMVLGIIRVRILKKRGSIRFFKGYAIVQLHHEIAPFSFFRTIYLNESSTDSPDKHSIISHEIIHIKQLHTCDKLFAEFFLAIFWFNPFMWFLKVALRTTHEYLADHEVINETPSRTDYQLLLLKQITGLSPSGVTSSFNSNIKNRIKMMCRNKSSLRAKFKPFLLIPMLACLTILFACNEQADDLSENTDFEMTSQKPDFPEGGEKYYIVDEMPEFNGGDPAIEFRKFIGQNLQYPEAASKYSIGGRVIIQFTVNREGKVVDAIIVRKVDPYLDEEALRLVNSSPKWTAGKQSGKEVNVLYTFPINFVVQ